MSTPTAESVLVTPRPSVSTGSDRSSVANGHASSSSAHASTNPYASSSSTDAGSARPRGIVNDGNTCFFNSTFQALTATPSLIDLLGPVILSVDPGRQQAAPAQERFVRDRIPSLRDEALEEGNVRLLPVTMAFERALGRAWKAKDDSAPPSTAPSVTETSDAAPSGSAPSSRKPSVIDLDKPLSLRALLRELSKKYDQYDGYRQQDAHELLRHLLDSMSMEERDLIKVFQPPSPPVEGDRKARKRARQADGRSKEEKERQEKEKMIPFVDALFGGSLVSAVICEGCKTVSHTYEGFLDISLSMKEPPAKSRKRDKFKAIAQKLRPGSSSKPPPETPSTSPPSVYLEGVHSDAELEGSAIADDTESVDRYSGTETNSPGELKKKSSLSWNRRSRTSRPSTSSSIASSIHESKDPMPRTSSVASASSASVGAPSPKIAPINMKRMGRSDDPNTPPAPTKAQAAYIRRLLNGPNLPKLPKDDPMEALKAGVPADGAETQNGHHHHHHPHLSHSHPRHPVITIEGFGTDLMECLKNFTQVEVLEGDNAFACRTCWKYKTGRMAAKARARANEARHSTVMEEDEDDDDDDEQVGREETPEPSNMSVISSMPSMSAASEVSSLNSMSVSGASNAGAQEIPSISVIQSESGEVPTTGALQLERNEPADGARSSRSQTRFSESNLRAPSPLRRHHTPGSEDAASSASALSGETTSEGETTSDEAGPGAIGITRPAMPPRRQSTHFVLNRAYKRYLIATAPPVLVFHFKRFQQSGKASASFYAATFASLKKMDDFVSFPEMLDVSPFMAPDRNDYRGVPQPDGTLRAPYLDHPVGDKGPNLDPMLYKLYGVVVHIGSSTLGGHYICYVLVDPARILEDGSLLVDPKQDPPNLEHLSLDEHARRPNADPKRPDNRVWYFCSDVQVRQASLDEVLRCKAYLTFYERWS